MLTCSIEMSKREIDASAAKRQTQFDEQKYEFQRHIQFVAHFTKTIFQYYLRNII